MTPNELARYREQTTSHSKSFAGVQTIRGFCHACKTHKPIAGSRRINGRRICSDCAPQRHDDNDE